jgi:Protein of unknown function (DUF2004)
MKIQTRIFGLIELDPVHSTFQRTEILVNGVSSICSLFIGEGLVDQPDVLARTFTWLEDLNALDQRVRRAFLEDRLTSTTGVVAGYISELEGLDDEIIARLFKKTDLTAISTEAFISQLKLCGVGLHLEQSFGLTVNLDYSLNPEFTDELLVARFNDDGAVLTLAHES